MQNSSRTVSVVSRYPPMPSLGCSGRVVYILKAHRQREGPAKKKRKKIDLQQTISSHRDHNRPLLTSRPENVRGLLIRAHGRMVANSTRGVQNSLTPWLSFVVIGCLGPLRSRLSSSRHSYHHCRTVLIVGLAQAKIRAIVQDCRMGGGGGTEDLTRVN